jgi:hypothetical protein
MGHKSIKKSEKIKTNSEKLYASLLNHLIT